LANKTGYEDALNPSQMEAVMTISGPVLVIAGAGSGKTRTLVYRVARLVEEQIPPESILLLTFTRKAASEMLTRAAELSDEGCQFVSGGTFHALANRILKRYADLAGFSNGFTILDRSDMEQIVTSLVPELGFVKRPPRFPKRGTIANILSKAANLQEPVDRFMLGEYLQFANFTAHISRLAELYADYKKANGLMDYDDLIIYLRDLLAENPDVRAELARQYRYVMVDEYQDTNSIQADIIKWLVADHQNIMVVGDDCQSIYSFRGANYNNMFDFPEQFPGTRLIRLEENYRSTQPVLDFTNAIMEQTDLKYTKCLFTRNKDGELPKVVETRTEPEQAAFVCRYITELIQRGRSISDLAVLFRAGYHSFELEAELARQGIAYVKHGGFKFLESAHIKDFMAHLRVVVNNDDAISWVRILTLVRNVGQTKAHKIIHWLKSSQIPPQNIEDWPGAGKKDAGGLKPLADLLTELAKERTVPGGAVEKVMRYYVPVMEQKFDDYPRRQKELDQLVSMAARYRDLKTFLDDLALDPPTSRDDISPEDKGDVLTLSTVHSAKGLEWRVVFIIWAVDGRFPPSIAFNDPFALEEERRLMYVAATRAKEELIICYPKEDPKAWKMDDRSFGIAGPSIFVRSVPDNLINYQRHRQTRGRIFSGAGYPDKRPPFSQVCQEPDLDKKNSSGISRGDMVSHPAFGPGVVSRFAGDDKVEVLFKKAGKKLLHLKYTRLEKI